MISIKAFHSKLLKIDKKSPKNIDVYYIGYLNIKKIDDYENVHSVDPLYLINGEVDGHFKDKNESKYLVFDSTDENRIVLQKFTKLWDGIKNKIEATNGGKEGEQCFKSDSDICNRCDWEIKTFGNCVIIHVNDSTFRFFVFDMTEEDVIEFIKHFKPDGEFETTLQHKRIDI